MSKTFKQASLFIGIGFGLLAALGLVGNAFQTWSHATTDRFFLPHDADDRIVIVAIDDASLARIGRWPWDRSIHAQLINRLTESGARVIALDVNFPESSEEGEDRALARAVASSGRVVLPLELNFTASNGALGFDSERIVQPIPAIQREAEAVGFSNTPLDADGVVRRVPLAVHGEESGSIRAFAFEAARLAERAPLLETVPTDEYGRMVINFPGRPGEAFPIVSAADVLRGEADASVFQDATVFIGATAPDLHDEQNVPTSLGDPMSGVEIHASVYDTLVQRRWLVPVPLWQGLLLILTGLILGLAVPRLRARNGALVAFGLLAAWLIGAFALFDRGYIVDIVWPTLLIIFGYAALLLERWIATERERRKIRHAFSRYVSESVVDSIMKDLDKLKLGGDRRNMSVLFSDLRGFTTLSEGMQPEQLVEVLNTYLDEMTDIVFETGGVLDKYIGDAVMAFWNAPFDQPDHASRAVRTAVKMRDRLAQMNKDGSFPKGIELRVGVGINTGDMVVGNIGGERRYDYTVIGDSVNLASRTEGLCKEYGVQVIVTENTRKELGDEFLVRAIDKVAVKGKKEPITIYEVMGFAADESDARHKLAAQFRETLNAYLAQDFKKAIEHGEAILAVWPEDGPTKNLIERCKTYLECPPLQGWDGTWVMTKK